MYFMKIFSKVTIFLFLIICSCSCVKSTSSDYVPVIPIDLSDSDTLTLKELSYQEYLPSYPEAMLLVNEKLIVQDRRGTGALFHKISELSVDKFVIFGNGPEDYLDANLNPFVYGKENVGFYDPIKKKVLIFNTGTELHKLLKVIDLRHIKENICEAIACGRYFLLTGKQGVFSTSRFLITDSTGQVVSKCNDYPEILPSSLNKPFDDKMKMLHSASFYRTSPDKQKAVFASYHGALIQFFDLSFLPDSLKEIHSSQLSLPMKHSQISETHAGWVYGFEDIFATDNYVYAVFNGCTALENPAFGFHLLKYDWMGNLKKSYVSEIGIRSIAVDEKANLLYLAGYNGDEIKLYVASLD